MSSRTHKYSQVLGFVTSVLSGNISGGTQHGVGFSRNEQFILEKCLSDLKESMIKRVNSDLAEAIEVLERAIQLMLEEGLELKREKTQGESVLGHFHFIGVKALKAFYALELAVKVEQSSDNVTCFLTAAKLITITVYYYEQSTRFNEQYTSVECSSVPTLPLSKNFNSLGQILKSIEINKVVCFLQQSGVFEQALLFTRCAESLPRLASAKNLLAMSSSSFSPLPPSTLKRGFKSDELSKQIASTEATSKSILFRRRKKKKKRSSTPIKASKSFFFTQFEPARDIASCLFSLSRILSRFGFESPVMYMSHSIKPSEVPQVFQQSFQSSFSKKFATEPISVEVQEKLSIVLHKDSLIEVFDNSSLKVWASAKLNLTCDVDLTAVCDELLVVSCHNKLHLLDLHSKSLEERRVFSFSKKKGNITSLMCFAGLVFTGFEKGSISMWTPDENKEKGDCNIYQNVLKWKEEVRKLTEYKVLFMEGDVFSDKIAAAYSGGQLCFWKAEAKKQVRYERDLIDSKHGEITSMCSWNGELFTGGEDGHIRIWDFTTGQLTVTLTKAHHSLVFIAPKTTMPEKSKKAKLNFSFLGGAKKKLKRMSSTGNLDTATVGGSFTKAKATPFAVTSIAVQDDVIVSAGNEGKIKIWDLSKDEEYPQPVEIETTSTVNDLRLKDQFLFALGHQLDRFELEGLLHKLKDKEKPRFVDNDISFNYIKPDNNSEGKIIPQFVMHFEKESERQTTQCVDVNEMQMRDVLDDRRLRKEFVKFVRKAQSGECVEFCIMCERFKRFYDLLPEQTRAREMRKLVHKFIEVGSEREINIGDAARQRVLGASERGEMSVSMFDEVLEDTYDLMTDNFLSGFKKHVLQVRAQSGIYGGGIGSSRL